MTEEDDFERDVERLKNRRKQMKIDIPEREPNEEPITEKQLSYIKHLSPNLTEKDLSGLGKWQASKIIDEIKSQIELFDNEVIEEYKEEQIQKLSKNRGWFSSLLFNLFKPFIFRS